MEIIELVNTYRQALTEQESQESARLLYNEIKQDLRKKYSMKVSPSMLEDAMILLEKAKPGCGQLLWKRWVARMKPKEIGKEINLKSDTVRMRIERCLEKLVWLMKKKR